MRTCNFIETETAGRWVCTNCERETPSSRFYAAAPMRPCKKMGAGDFVAVCLSLVGVTKQKVTWLANKVGIVGCGCEQRQDWLNAIGTKIYVRVMSMLR